MSNKYIEFCDLEKSIIELEKSGVFEAYERTIPKMEQGFNTYLTWFFAEFCDEISRVMKPLTPIETDLFLQLMVTDNYYAADKYLSFNHPEQSGIFISALIQNSYNAGHNDFRFTTGPKWKDLWEHKLKNLGDYLQGENEMHMKIQVPENYKFSFDKVSYCDIDIDSNHVSYLSERAHWCYFTIAENRGLMCFREAESCVFESSDFETLDSIWAHPWTNYWVLNLDGEKIDYSGAKSIDAPMHLFQKADLGMLSKEEWLAMEKVNMLVGGFADITRMKIEEDKIVLFSRDSCFVNEGQPLLDRAKELIEYRVELRQIPGIHSSMLA